MKKTFLTNMLPMMAAAVLLATSCSKDSDNDNITTPAATVKDDAKIVPTTSETPTIPFSITVGKASNSLSKATVDASTLTQTFEAGDVLEISGTGISGTLTLKSGDEGKAADATFEGNLSGDGVASITDETQFTATLTNATNGNSGTELTTVQSATSLAEAFQKFGYWTASFTYGTRNDVELVQNTVFLRVKPFHGTTTATINGTSYTAQADGTIYLAVKSGTDLTSNLFSGTKTVTNGNGKVVKNIDRSDVLPGVFSVSEDKQIRFSKGNLQYDADNGTWIFATNQYDYIGNASGNISETSGIRDFFGWGTWLDGSNPMRSSTNSLDYSWDYSKSSAIGKEWETLTAAEWQYIFVSRDYSSKLYGGGSVNGVNGLILLPDEWTSPDGLSFTQGTIVWSNNSYDGEQWAKMEAAGAVFLPAAGCRGVFGLSDIFDVGNKGRYWTKTSTSSYYASLLYFGPNFEQPNVPADDRSHLGASVRLVRGLE